jgi:queuine tRNA-ribosyltransferase
MPAWVWFTPGEETSKPLPSCRWVPRRRSKPCCRRACGELATFVLGNTYHLMLRPGAERIAQLGGLHKFMNWEGPILTDSGGFQVMSLAKLRKITKTACCSDRISTGSEHHAFARARHADPALLGSDIQMVLDECPAFPATEAEIEKSLMLSLRWAKRSKEAFAASRDGRRSASCRAAFIVLCAAPVGARADEKSASTAMPIGGLAVGESQVQMFAVLEAVDCRTAAAGRAT